MNGAIAQHFGQYGTDSGEFNSPSSVAVGGDGSYYIADVGNERVQICNGVGNCQEFMGGTEVGSLASGSDGLIVVIDKNEGSVRVYVRTLEMIFLDGFESGY